MPSEELDLLRKQIAHCIQCPLNNPNELSVPGEGSTTPDIMIIGEAPGQSEADPLLHDEAGVPFIGPAGMLLTDVLREAGWAEQKLFVTNVVKHRPPHNRTPTIKEQTICQEFLTQQIQVLAPKVILCLGRVATDTLCRLNNIQPMGTFIGMQARTIKSIPIFFSYHPSYILRNPDKRNILIEDIAWVLKFLETI